MSPRPFQVRGRICRGACSTARWSTFKARRFARSVSVAMYRATTTEQRWGAAIAHGLAAVAQSSSRRSPMPDTKPTVTASDRAAAFKALPCLCEWPVEGQHTTPCPRVYWPEVAAEIAAAREAWGAELTAELQGLREIATSGPSTATGRSPLSHRKVLDAQDHLDIMRGGGDADYAEAVAGLVEVAGEVFANDSWCAN